ncbi:bile acid:sodium symporter family protein [bacterium]|nr:bile acid:sodium symporter family protein [bacterium]
MSNPADAPSRGAALWFSGAILIFAILGFALPGAFKWGLASHSIGGYQLSVIKVLLGIVMLGMGMTLTAADLALLAKRPWEVFIGLAAQFGIMGGLAWVIVTVLRLPTDLAVGVILVGACPGGTASNVIAWMARGDVALSVAMTTTSTLVAPVVTPFLATLLIGERVDVNAMALVWSVVEIVLGPVLIGLLIRRFAGGAARLMIRALPLISIVSIGLIVAIVVAAGKDRLLSAGALVVLAVALHNSAGLGLGYLLGRAVGMDEARRRTLAIEVGMQNSGLATALAKDHFPALAGATLPGAVFSVWHNISGALLAAWWARRG